MGAKVIELGPHSRMTPTQALAQSSREDWETVIVCGFHKGDGRLVVRSSDMSREFGLWIAEHLKKHALSSE